MSLPTPTVLRWTALLVALLCAVSACSPSSSDSAPRSSSSKAAATPPKPLTYAALGDSYVAAPLVPVTDFANGCFRSSGNYPALVAEQLGATLDDRSCAAAQTVDLGTSQQAEVPAQLSAVKADTDLVTLGIGGNDGGLFRQLVGTCPQVRAQDPDGAPCRDAMTATGQDKLLATLAGTGVKVTAALRTVHQKAPKATVLVVGYPTIVEPGQACTKLPLAAGDYAYVARIGRALNAMLRTAAGATGSTYVDVAAASKGHGVCSDDPWINGAVNDQQRAAPYHPFAEEQQAVAKLVVEAAKS